MSIHIWLELCTGCGVCVEACAVDAIHLVDQRAVINHELCTNCKTCLYTCPNGAIIALTVPAHSMPDKALLASEFRIIPSPTKTELPGTPVPARGLVSTARSVLAFLGSEVTPRLVDILMNALERRFARPATTGTTPLPTSPGSSTSKNAGKRRQARFSGGQIGIGNLKGRR